MNQNTILLVEDDSHIMKINRTALTMSGYRVLEADTVARGRALFVKEKPDLILLDIMLPDGDGLRFCEELRGNSGVPILFLSALGRTAEIVKGLEAGGDDYLPKPYDLNVLIARIEALLRRARNKPESVLKRESLTLDLVSQCVVINGESTLLSPKEFAVLLYFMRNEERQVQAAELYQAAWGQPMGNDPGALKATIVRLRKKIRAADFDIISIRGIGYCFGKFGSSV